MLLVECIKYIRSRALSICFFSLLYQN